MLKSYQKVCNTCAPWGMTALRVVLGLIFILHGYPKLFGESAQLLAFFESTVLPMPSVMLFIAGVLELVGGILLILGLFTRFVATLLVIEFMVIILFVKLQMGFSAFEFDLLILASLFVITSAGAGAASGDHMLQQRKMGGESQKGGHADEAISG